LSNIELNFLAFFQCFEAFALDRGEMNEYVVSTIDLNESVAFFCVKPFNCTFQVNNLLKISPSVANIKIIPPPAL